MYAAIRTYETVDAQSGELAPQSRDVNFAWRSP